MANNNNKKFSVVFRNIENGVGYLQSKVVDQNGLTILSNNEHIQICVVRELEA